LITMTNQKNEEQASTTGYDENRSMPRSSFGQSRPAFRGNFTHSIDDKSRVSLPADFRKTLDLKKDSSIVITNYISEGARCLEGFGISAWVEFEEKLKQKSRFSPKLQKLENFYLSRAAECSIDRSGRILIPSHLRSYAGIEKEITFTSSIHGFRIWDRRVWEMIFESSEQALLEDPELFSDIDI